MNTHANAMPPRPSTQPFKGLPRLPAIDALRARKQWVAWNYEWRPNPSKPEGGDWTKPPLNPRNGYPASHSKASSWGSYDEAAYCAQKSGLPGVGYVLSPDDELTGIDLDKCRDAESGTLESWAAEIVALAETYAEVSPSGTGIRLLALGKIERTVKCDPAHVEIYEGKRYLTITGQHLPGTPTDIRPAPRTLDLLMQRVSQHQGGAEGPAHSPERPKPNGGIFGTEGNKFFKKVNSEALANLGSWVPELFGSAAAYQPTTRGFRVSSRDLGRDLQEDLSITPEGIKDFGVHDIGDPRKGKRTAIDLLMVHRGERIPAEAALWLCDRLGINPKAIGWNGEAASVEAGATAENSERLDNGSTPPSFYLSFGPYRMGKTGLYHDAGGDASPSWLAAPFEILAATRDDLGSNWGLMLRWRDPDGREHTWAMPRALLYGDGGALCAALAERGLSVAPGTKSRNLMLGYLAFAKPEERLTCVSRTGWHEGQGRSVYVLPDRTFGDAPDNRLVLQAATIVRSPFEVRGSLTQWQKEVAQPCEGNSRLVFAISAALAGPLLAPTNTEGGGFHFYGASSQGKTTTLQVGASVWGRGDKPGFVGTWRATSNGLEGIAGMHSDAALVLDEIAQADAKTVAETVYMLAQGIGKARANRTGEARAPQRWRSLILSSGEMTIPAKIGEERGRRVAAGQMVRVLDVPSDAGKGLGAFDCVPAGFADAKTFADHLKAATKDAYGTAGPAMVEAMIKEGFDSVRSVLGQCIASWSAKHCPAKADGQIRRAADRFALVAAAGEFAILSGVVPWTTGAATAAAAQLFTDWIAARGGVEPAEIASGIAQVRRFIEAFGESRFSLMDAVDQRVIPNRAGFRRGYDEEREWLVLPETWKIEVAAGHDAGALARTLAERGMMKTGGDGKPQVKTHLPSLGKARVYILTERLFSGE